MLTAAGAGIGVVVVTSVGQALTPFEPVGLLAPRQPSKGPLGVAVDLTAEEANVIAAATASHWTLQITGPMSYALTLAEVEAMAGYEARFPISCGEGWSVDALWRGLRLLDVVERAGGTAGSQIRVRSLQQAGPFNKSVIFGQQLSRALLATHLNGERLTVDHGYLAADRPEPRLQVQHQMAGHGRGALMRVWRIVLGVLGIGAATYGISQLLTHVPVQSLVLLALWLIAALIIHDGLLSPVVVGVGSALRRYVPDRGRRAAVRFDHECDGHRDRRPDDLSGQHARPEQGLVTSRLRYQPHRAARSDRLHDTGRLRHPNCARSVGAQSSAARRHKDVT